MDALEESLANSFSVSSDANSTDAPHPRFSDYKKKTSASDQENRRKDILDLQRSRRFDFANHARRLVEDDWHDSDDLEDDEGEGEAMDATESTSGKHRTYKPGRYYRNQLMLSEWLVQVPEDFDENWLMVACPWGKRCLIVAAQGSTTAYGRNGYRVNSFPSHLPGGNRQQKDKYRDNVIMDCIYHEVEKTFYVLDIMNWKNNPVYDSDTDFRYFWMISKMQEIPEVGEVSKLNPYKFVPLQYHACKLETLKEVLNSTTQQLDGCLFYHKQAHYTFGRSPLVVWLKPYMVPEMLGVEVPDILMSQKPANYSTYAGHLQQVKESKERIEKEREEKAASRKSKRGPDRSRQFKMDLMESKWLTSIPEKFDTDWMAVVCPVGQRCLVMAIDGETKWYSKKGYKLPGYFLSILPGGNGTEYGFGPTVVTLLDCVYCEEMMTYFILDAMLWGGHDLKELPYEERTKYVRKQISQRPEYKAVTPLNMFRLCSLYQYECTLEGLDQALRQSTFEIDGILFYKKDTPYVSAETDEVLWIKPYILPDVFEGIAVPSTYMSQKPDSYTDFATFVDDVQNGRIKSKKNKRKKGKNKFVPDVVLKLPPAREKPLTKAEKKKLQQQSQQKRGGWANSPNNRANWGWSTRGGGTGQRGDNYGRALASAGGDAPFGKGAVTGYQYYGDDRDFYHPSQSYGPREGRRGNYQDVFGLGDMHDALNYYNFDRAPGRPTRGRQQFRK